MLQKNFKVVPSPSIRDPAGGNYYSGGYITQTYGVKDRLNAIQMEFPYFIRKDFANTAKTVAASIYEFYTTHSLGKKL
jgi:hypothetical protein